MEAPFYAGFLLSMRLTEKFYSKIRRFCAGGFFDRVFLQSPGACPQEKPVPARKARHRAAKSFSGACLRIRPKIRGRGVLFSAGNLCCAYIIPPLLARIGRKRNHSLQIRPPLCRKKSGRRGIPEAGREEGKTRGKERHAGTVTVKSKGADAARRR